MSSDECRILCHTIRMSSRSPYALPGMVAAVAVLTFFAVFSFLNRKPHIELPQGEQEITGILKPVSLSGTRRGTHVLEIDEEPFVFVESEDSLKPFEGLKVTVRGTFEENTDTSLLPVIVATSVKPKTLALTQWKHDTLGLTLSAPSSWNGETDEDSLTFVPSNATTPILRVVIADTDELPAGQSQGVGGEKAVSVKNGSGETVYVEKNGKIIGFDFSPSETGQGLVEQQYEFRQVVLRSVVFNAKASSPTGSVSGSASGTVLGQPCGGDAGILCPAGQYCEVTDSVTDIGRCKSLR
jgi:hypothetical protein